LIRRRVFQSGESCNLNGTDMSATRSVAMRSSLPNTSQLAARPITTLALGLFAASVSFTTAQALECPVVHQQGGKGFLRESHQDISDISGKLTEHGADAAPGLVAGLKARHPKATNGEIINYLITAYCPVVNREGGKSEAEKKTQIAQFNKAVVSLLYK
jgi:hypothetical protein